MANFLVVVEQDDAHRAAIIERARATIAPLPDLKLDHIDLPGCAILWAANRAAPVTRQTVDGCAAVCFGEPRDDQNDSPLTAGDLDRIWWHEDAVAAFDGFFAAVAWHPQRGLIVGTDILGIFPVYHWRQGNTLLVSSSPAMMHAHPQFTATIDYEGLAAILLTQGILGSRTMLANVSRLLPGRSLNYTPGGEVTEPVSFAMQPDDRYFDTPASRQIDLMHDALDQATNRQVNAQLDHLILLSGGRDSRMVAGFAQRAGLVANALSLGDQPDLEVQFARQVADELHWPHHFTDVVTADRLPGAVQRCMRYEYLAGGMDSPNGWELHRHVQALGQRTLTGLALDPIIGGTHMAWGYDEQTGRVSLTRYRDMLLKYGISATDVRAMLRQHDGAAIVDRIIGKIDNQLNSYSGADALKTVCYDMHHRQRLHVGAWLWQLSFAAWPLTPALDRNLVRTCLSIAPCVLMNRFAQEQILIRRLPDLADIPVDRNSENTAPLRVSFRTEFRQRLARRLGPLGRYVAPKAPQGTSRWKRTYDFDGDAWRAARRLAEPHRDALGELLDRATLDRLLPPPEQSINAANVFTGGAGRRMLLALMLFAGSATK